MKTPSKTDKAKALTIMIANIGKPKGAAPAGSPSADPTSPDSTSSTPDVSSCPTCGHACPYCEGAKEASPK